MVAIRTGLVTQLPSNSWFEGFAGLPNGHIFAARADQPELYTIDPDDQDTEPKLVYSFEEERTNGIVNICPLAGHANEYVCLTAFVDLVNVKADNYNVWRVSFSDLEYVSPKVTRIAHLPRTGLALGLASISERTLVVCDSVKACIYALDTRTGESSVLVEDEVFKAASTEDFFGINRLCFVDGSVWFTNSSAGILGRVPIKVEVKDDGSEMVGTKGPVDILTRDLLHCDGLAVVPDGKAVYTACYLDGKLWRIEIDDDGSTSTHVVMENLDSPTAVELVSADGEPRLYVVCNGEIKAYWTNSLEEGWHDIADMMRKVSIVSQVTVMTETSTSEDTSQG